MTQRYRVIEKYNDNFRGWRDPALPMEIAHFRHEMDANLFARAFLAAWPRRIVKVEVESFETDMFD